MTPLLERKRVLRTPPNQRTTGENLYRINWLINDIVYTQKRNKRREYSEELMKCLNAIVPNAELELKRTTIEIEYEE